MLSGYADVHVPFPIVQGLRTRGMDVVTAQERRQQQEEDAVLLSQALQERRVMLTCDHDFLLTGGVVVRAGPAVRSDLLLAATRPVNWRDDPPHST